MIHGRYGFNLADAPALDIPFNALPGVDRDVFIRQNIAASQCVTDLAATATGVGILTPIYLVVGDIVTYLTFVSGNTAAGTPTNYWHALYDIDGALLAQSADQLTAAWAANTAKKLALSSPVTAEYTGWYYAATSSTATTVQTLIGCAPIVTASAAIHADSLKLGATFGSAMAGTAPATAGTLTGVAKCPLVVVS